MALKLTQPLTEEMNTRNLPKGKRWPLHEADNLTATCEPTAYKMWEPQGLTILWNSMVCYRGSFISLLDMK
jgi:hypothetical protein